MPSLDIENVSKLYGDIKALDNVSLHVDDKEYVCVIGPSGCGKSTLIKCVAGIIQPTSGQILIDGKPVRDLPIEDRNIGYVFQDIALFPHMTVRENVSYGLMVRNAAKDQITTVSNEMLDLISMRDRSKSHPNELSGGAQQKVAVGRAIATGSHFFLLDEPLGALDALVRAELRYELRRLASDLGLTVIHVTHDQEEALSIADRVVVMKRGAVVEAGRPAELYHSPKNIFTENFVGETNLLEGKIMEANGTDYVVEVRGARIRMLASAGTVGQRVVVAIRPEFVPLVPANAEGNEWRGRIKEVAFLGSIKRYIVELGNGLNIVAHIPTVAECREFQVGDDVNLQLGSGEHTLLFDYPEGGLEKETALE